MSGPPWKPCKWCGNDVSVRDAGGNGAPGLNSRKAWYSVVDRELNTRCEMNPGPYKIHRMANK